MKNSPGPTVAADSLDPEAWLERYGDDLYAYAITRLRSPEAAEEVVQQTFVAGLQAAHQYAGRGSERGWLLGILKRKVIDFIRQRQRTSSLTDDEGEDRLDSFFDERGHWRASSRSALGQPLDSIERGEFWQILRSCLEGLPERQADAFVLREIDEQETAEICKVLGVTASNLWVLLHRARLRLSQCMGSRWRDASR